MTHTLYIAAIREKPILNGMPWGKDRQVIGMRYVIFCRTGPTEIWSVELYTVNPWIASLCAVALKDHQPITVETRETKWGSEIAAVVPLEKVSA